MSCLLMAITYYYKDNLPAPNAYDMTLLGDPIQTTTTRAPFIINANQYGYTITPKFDYELTGVVVSSNDADGFTDIWHHDRWKDFINIRDLCVVWGSNISSGAYKKISVSNDSWTCWVSWQDRETSNLFHSTELSNNHLLTDNPSIKAALKKAEKGDVIRFTGVLAEYKNNENGAQRGTSITRKDNGNGACETVYLDKFQIIKKANPGLRKLYEWSKWSAILSFIILLILVGITPYKPHEF